VPSAPDTSPGGRRQRVQTNPVNLYVHDRSQPEPPFGHGVVQAFPAMIRPLERAAVKWLGSYRKNPLRNLPAISAIDLVTDTETGMPLALVDGTSVTNLRTAARAVPVCPAGISVKSSAGNEAPTWR
jgi:ornithine cyclodeaminase/alanine dehydrogenase-like protein (mu-crystallin family)